MTYTFSIIYARYFKKGTAIDATDEYTWLSYDK